MSRVCLVIVVFQRYKLFLQTKVIVAVDLLQYSANEESTKTKRQPRNVKEIFQVSTNVNNHL